MPVCKGGTRVRQHMSGYKGAHVPCTCLCISRGGTRVTQQCTSPRLFLQVIPSVNSLRVGKKAAPTAFPTPTPSLGTLRWHGGHREEGADSVSPLGPQSSGQGPCPWEPEASPWGLPGAPRCSLQGTVGGGGRQDAGT